MGCLDPGKYYSKIDFEYKLNPYEFEHINHTDFKNISSDKGYYLLNDVLKENGHIYIEMEKTRNDGCKIYIEIKGPTWNNSSSNPPEIDINNSEKEYNYNFISRYNMDGNRVERTDKAEINRREDIFKTEINDLFKALNLTIDWNTVDLRIFGT